MPNDEQPNVPIAVDHQAAEMERPKFKDLLEKNLVWFAFGLIVAGAVGAVGFLSFVSSRIKAEVQTPEMVALMASKIPNGVPKGALVLFAVKCPDGWEDMTTSMDGRYLYVDAGATTYSLHEQDGSHKHTGGAHTHKVTGQVVAGLGGGERAGTKDGAAPHFSNRPTIAGTATTEDSPHEHGGGAHQHRRIGARLCKS